MIFPTDSQHSSVFCHLKPCKFTLRFSLFTFISKQTPAVLQPTQESAVFLIISREYLAAELKLTGPRGRSRDGKRPRGPADFSPEIGPSFFSFHFLI